MRSTLPLLGLLLPLASLACSGTSATCPSSSPDAPATTPPTSRPTPPARPSSADAGSADAGDGSLADVAAGLHPAYQDDVRRLVQSSWSPVSVPLQGCADLVADRPAETGLGLVWGACPGGAPEWSCAIEPRTSPDQNPTPFEVMGADATWVGGIPHLIVRRRFAWGSEILERANLDTLQPLEGPPAHARLRGFRGKDCGGELRASAEGIGDYIYADSQPHSGALLFWSPLSAPRTFSYRWFYPRDFGGDYLEGLVLAKRFLNVAMGDPRDGVFIHRETGDTTKARYPIQRRTTENPLQWDDGVIGISRAFERPDALYYFYDADRQVYIDASGEGLTMVQHAIDRTKGEVVWSELGRWDGEGRTPGVLKVARRDSLGGLTGTVVAPVSEYYEWGHFVANAGVVTFLSKNGDAVLVRTTDGLGWRLPQPKGFAWRGAVWVDDTFVWFGIGGEGTLRDGYLTGLLRIPRSSLGDAAKLDF